MAGRDYESFMLEEDEVVVWPSEDEIGNDDKDDGEEDGGDAPADI